MSRARDLADSADKDIAGTLTLDGLSVSGDVAVNTDTLFVDASADKVGIGTSSPDRTLTVNSGGTNGVATFESTDSTAVVWVADGNSANTSQVGLGAVTDDMLLYAGGTERMRIDSSGNLLVGTTTLGLYNQSSETGLTFGSNLQIARDGGVVQYLNRLTSYGDIVQFRKNGATVGSIGVGGRPWFAMNPSTCNFSVRLDNYNTTNGILAPAVASDTTADGLHDLGYSGGRWKDLYLSGGVYLGGTGSANYLDDYEEGLHTALLSCSTSGTITLSNDALSYTKIGRVVHLQGRLTVSSVSSPTGDIVLSLPFALANTAEDSARTVGYIQIQNATSNLNEFGFYATESGSTIPLVVTGGNTSEHSGLSAMAAEFSGDEFISINLTYITS
jgi:hypothetical protein